MRGAEQSARANLVRRIEERRLRPRARPGRRRARDARSPRGATHAANDVRLPRRVVRRAVARRRAERVCGAVRGRGRRASSTGYLSGLVPTRGGSRPRVDAVSVVSGPRTPHRERVIAGFEEGVAMPPAGRRGACRVRGRRLRSDRVRASSRTSRSTRLGRRLRRRPSSAASARSRSRGCVGCGRRAATTTASLPGSHVLLITDKDSGGPCSPRSATTPSRRRVSARTSVLGLDDEYAVGFDRDGSLSPRRLGVSLVEGARIRCSEIRQRAAASSLLRLPD